MDEPKRQHKATGAPRGGKRNGAGRPKGSTSPFLHGEIQAVKACRWRVPDSAPEEAKVLADRALQRIADVMEGLCPFGGREVLGAATRIREEVCGPLTQKVQVGGDSASPVQVVIQKYGDNDAE